METLRVDVKASTLFILVLPRLKKITFSASKLVWPLIRYNKPELTIFSLCMLKSTRRFLNRVGKVIGTRCPARFAQMIKWLWNQVPLTLVAPIPAYLRGIKLITQTLRWRCLRRKRVYIETALHQQSLFWWSI